MAFEIISKNLSVSIDSQDEVIFTFLQQYEINSPTWNNLRDQFYSDPAYSQERIHSLLSEIYDLRKAYIKELSSKSNITAKKPEIRDFIIQRIIQDDMIITKIDEIARVLQDAIENNVGIQCLSD